MTPEQWQRQVDLEARQLIEEGNRRAQAEARARQLGIDPSAFQPPVTPPPSPPTDDRFPTGLYGDVPINDGATAVAADPVAPYGRTTDWPATMALIAALGLGTAAALRRNQLARYAAPVITIARRHAFLIAAIGALIILWAFTLARDMLSFTIWQSLYDGKLLVFGGGMLCILGLWLALTAKYDTNK